MASAVRAGDARPPRHARGTGRLAGQRIGTEPVDAYDTGGYETAEPAAGSLGLRSLPTQERPPGARDQDVFEKMGGAYESDRAYSVLFENPGSSHGWLGLELQGTRANRSAIGARVIVTLRTPRGGA